MAKITWLGEDDLANDIPGPSFNTWNGIRFPKGVAVEVADEYMVAKARENQFYKVTGDEPKINKIPKEIKEAAHAQEKTQEHPEWLQNQAQKKVERQEQGQGYDYRQAEKATGYSPKKKDRKAKRSGHRDAQADPRPDTSEPDGA